MPRTPITGLEFSTAARKIWSASVSIKSGLDDCLCLYKTMLSLSFIEHQMTKSKWQSVCIPEPDRLIFSAKMKIFEATWRSPGEKAYRIFEDLTRTLKTFYWSLKIRIFQGSLQGSSKIFKDLGKIFEQYLWRSPGEKPYRIFEDLTRTLKILARTTLIYIIFKIKTHFCSWSFLTSSIA